MYEGGIYVFDCVSAGAYESKGEDRCFLAAIDSGVEKSVGVLGFKLMIFPKGKIFRCALPSCGP